VKQITEILNKEIKFLKQTSHIDSNGGNSWSVATSSNSRVLTNVRPSKELHTTHGIPVASWYAVPVSNRYAVLSNHLEPQKLKDMLFSFILNNHQDSCQLITTSTSRDFKGGNLYP
jgi:hypothetical protein